MGAKQHIDEKYESEEIVLRLACSTGCYQTSKHSKSIRINLFCEMLILQSRKMVEDRYFVNTDLKVTEKAVRMMKKC